MSETELPPSDFETLLAPLAERGILSSVGRLDADVASLHAEERQAVASAIPRRQAEFAAGRLAARRLCSALGAAPGPLLPGTRREPLWPAGLTGSISHGAARCVVVVARTESVRALGVDVEELAPLERKLWRTICTETERRWLDTQEAARRGLLARLFFSAKEAAYKCQFPITGSFLGFQEVEVELDVPGARFSITFGTPASGELQGTTVAGRLCLEAERLLTLMSYGQEPSPSLKGRSER